MAIDGYTGIPGAGKSHGVVERVIIPALQAGRLVVHNMPLDESKLLGLAGAGSLQKLDENITRERIVAEFPAGAVLVLDEAWRFWPAGLKANNIPEAEREFFAMHRHMVGEDGRSTDLIIVCQDLGQIASFIRDLVEQTFRYTKQTAVGSRTRYRCDVYQGAVTGPKPPATRLTAQQHGKYRPEIYACYQSHTLSKTGAAGIEEKIDKRGSVFGRWTVKAAAVAVLLVPVVGFYAYKSFFKVAPQNGVPSVSEHSERTEGTPVPVALTVQAPPPPPPTRYSTVWRFAGRITVGARDVWVVQGERGARYLTIGECSTDAAENHRCLLDGEVVTEWTGPQDGFLERSFSEVGNLKPST